MTDTAPSHPSQGMATIITMQRVPYAELLTAHSLELCYYIDSAAFPCPGAPLRFDAAEYPSSRICVPCRLFGRDSIIGIVLRAKHGRVSSITAEVKPRMSIKRRRLGGATHVNDLLLRM